MVGGWGHVTGSHSTKSNKMAISKREKTVMHEVNAEKVRMLSYILSEVEGLDTIDSWLRALQ